MVEESISYTGSLAPRPPDMSPRINGRGSLTEYYFSNKKFPTNNTSIPDE
jgi:hypothetical protein